MAQKSKPFNGDKNFKEPKIKKYPQVKTPLLKLFLKTRSNKMNKVKIKGLKQIKRTSSTKMKAHQMN